MSENKEKDQHTHQSFSPHRKRAFRSNSNIYHLFLENYMARRRSVDISNSLSKSL